MESPVLLLTVAQTFLPLTFLILEGKRPLGRSRRRWVDNIKMSYREVGWDGVDWIDMA
jgi:hypothetical protein